MGTSKVVSYFLKHHQIFILDKEEKLDSILIDRFLPISDREQRKIDSFINGDI